MAITTNVHFEPTTDTFGNLIVHTRRVHGRAFAKAAAMPRAHMPKCNLNMLMIAGFLASAILATGAVYAVDHAVFAPSSDQVRTYGGVALDYD